MLAVINPSAPASLPTSPSCDAQNNRDANIISNNVSGDEHNREILRDILSELDRERRERAELEAKNRKLVAENKSKQKVGKDEMVISKRRYIAMQTELEGYRKLVEVLTLEKPAVSEALKASTRQRFLQTLPNNATPPLKASLPIHVVRLLEICPWDTRAMEYASATDEIFEFQFYDSKQKKWQSEIKHAPKAIQLLPTEEPGPGASGISKQNNKEQRALIPFLAGNELLSATLPSRCVLTNEKMTKVYDVAKGIKLPDDGGIWQWVGNWRVEKRVSLSGSDRSESMEQPSKIDCDSDGWSYATDPAHFLYNTAKTCWDNPGDESEAPNVLRPIRRRRWIRQRALIDYPFASESSKSFLYLMAQRMYATLAATKISEQLVDTKVALTEAESLLMQCSDEIKLQSQLMKTSLAINKHQKLTEQELKSTLDAACQMAERMESDLVELLRFGNEERFTGMRRFSCTV